jgi:hypothetical protein
MGALRDAFGHRATPLLNPGMRALARSISDVAQARC